MCTTGLSLRTPPPLTSLKLAILIKLRLVNNQINCMPVIDKYMILNKQANFEEEKMYVFLKTRLIKSLSWIK